MPCRPRRGRLLPTCGRRGQSPIPARPADKAEAWQCRTGPRFRAYRGALPRRRYAIGSVRWLARTGVCIRGAPVLRLLRHLRVQLGAEPGRHGLGGYRQLRRHGLYRRRACRRRRDGEHHEHVVRRRGSGMGWDDRVDDRRHGPVDGRRGSSQHHRDSDQSYRPIFPGSGPFKKDVGIFNNSPSPIDVIVDVVGYFIENTATPLDCQRILDTDFSLAAFSRVIRIGAVVSRGLHSHVRHARHECVRRVHRFALREPVPDQQQHGCHRQQSALRRDCCRVPGR